MVDTVTLKGWVEEDGRHLSAGDVGRLLEAGPSAVGRFGGEFLLMWNDCMARDHFGIIPGPCPAGSVYCTGREAGTVSPDPPAFDLHDAIAEAVRLRSDEGVTALSGGVDSSLIAALAGLPCVAVGLPGSHDLERAAYVAEKLGLTLHAVELTPAMISAALLAVVLVIPDKNPVDASIAATQYCIASWAAEHGYSRILAGQGADELFGGYARYLESADIAGDLAKDFRGLAGQCARDQAVAGLHGTSFSLPYLDIRVVRAARALPPAAMVEGGVRKRPLRRVAEREVPADIARYEKKAMQYGSGVWKVIRQLARENGYKKSVQGYINQIGETAHDGI
ncbi:MAG: asparagine synthase [Methanoculleus sp. SDB]|nr:MAG: asparagine synthase [Methanoculleus sp. SDB]